MLPVEIFIDKYNHLVIEADLEPIHPYNTDSTVIGIGKLQFAQHDSGISRL